MIEVFDNNLQVNPLVSIIVRTKDRPKLLKRALQSIASQTYRSLEVVLVNDGGCDLDVVELKSILQDVSLNYIRLEKNMGRAHAGNVGIENSKGEYVGFLDDDDIYFPGCLASLVSASEGKDDRVIYGKVVCRTYADASDVTPVEEKIMGESFDAGRLVLENFIPINALCIPRYFFRKAGMFDIDFPIYEDWDLLIRFSEIGSFHYIDTLVAEYSIHGSATITGKGGIATQTYYREKILEKHRQRIHAHDFITYVQRIIDKIVLEKEERVHQLSGLLQNMDEELKRLREGVAWLQETIKVKDDEIERSDEELKRLREGVAWLRETIKVKDQELKGLSEGMVWLQETIKVKDSELENILSSDSWRITKPLRVLGSVLKRAQSR